MADALTAVSTRRTPQGEQADERQVPNSAGGWVFETTVKQGGTAQVPDARHRGRPRST